ncbi:MAG TPA: hypothetical protein VMU88_05795 [bacterium]|nr:hypothetical protein [bacterium]
MRKLIMLWGALWALAAAAAWGQGTLELEPLGLETRYDDNVFRLVSEQGRLSDAVEALSGGLGAQTRFDGFDLGADYSLNADLYRFYSQLNNFTHDFHLDFSKEAGAFRLSYTNDTFIRSSGYYEFDYFDEASLLSLVYSPEPGWSLEGDGEILAREYYADADYVVSRNFTDDGLALSVQRVWSSAFSAKLGVKYDDRQFNRYAVVVPPSGGPVPAAFLQNDDTWMVDLGVHAYFLKVLQDIHVSAARTNSNSYGFSNAVESVSWAGVLSPAKDFYLELFFRLYEKDYDFQPLGAPDLQMGFTNDDGQDLLAVKGTLEWAPGWRGSLSVSRMKNESTQPGAYYIKDVVSAQILKQF